MNDNRRKSRLPEIGCTATIQVSKDDSRFNYGASWARVIRAVFNSLVVIFLLGLPCCFAKSDELLFAARALEFRDAGVAGNEGFLAVVSAMPGSAIVEPELLLSLWAPSFANTIVKLGRLRSDAPVSLYYDPLLDIAVIAYWNRTDDGYSIRSVRTLTGKKCQVTVEKYHWHRHACRPLMAR